MAYFFFKTKIYIYTARLSSPMRFFSLMRFFPHNFFFFHMYFFFSKDLLLFFGKKKKHFFFDFYFSNFFCKKRLFFFTIFHTEKCKGTLCEQNFAFLTRFHTFINITIKYNNVVDLKIRILFTQCSFVFFSVKYTVNSLQRWAFWSKIS